MSGVACQQDGGRRNDGPVRGGRQMGAIAGDMTRIRFQHNVFHIFPFLRREFIVNQIICADHHDEPCGIGQPLVENHARIMAEARPCADAVVRIFLHIAHENGFRQIAAWRIIRQPPQHRGGQRVDRQLVVDAPPCFAAQHQLAVGHMDVLPLFVLFALRDDGRFFQQSRQLRLALSHLFLHERIGRQFLAHRRKLLRVPLQAWIAFHVLYDRIRLRRRPVMRCRDGNRLERVFFRRTHQFAKIRLAIDMDAVEATPRGLLALLRIELADADGHRLRRPPVQIKTRLLLRLVTRDLAILLHQLTIQQHVEGFDLPHRARTFVLPQRDGLHIHRHGHRDVVCSRHRRIDDRPPARTFQNQIVQRDAAIVAAVGERHLAAQP